MKTIEDNFADWEGVEHETCKNRGGGVTDMGECIICPAVAGEACRPSIETIMHCALRRSVKAIHRGMRS